MLIIWIARIFFVLLAFGSIGLFIYAVAPSEDPDSVLPRKKTYIIGSIGLFFFSIMGLGVWIAAKYVPATSVAIVENTTSGNFTTIGPGVHVWPFQSNLVPFASKTTIYSLKAREIEIGTEDDSKGISAGSNSPGNPTVYIQAKGWAQVNKDNLIQLHRKYGSGYLDNWVERNWVTSIKSVQGQHGYDYLIGSRQKFADEVEQTLQAQLLENDKPLVTVSQLAVSNFEFDDRINEQLQQTAQKQFERQRATEDVEIARQKQQRDKVEAETRNIVAKTDAATAIEAARGEAESIRLINESISQQGDQYLFLKWIEKWQGTVPQVQTGEGSGTFFQIPLNVK